MVQAEQRYRTARLPVGVLIPGRMAAYMAARMEAKQSPEVGEDFADVVAAGAEDGEDGIAECPFQRAARQTAIGFHVPDLSFDSASSSQQRCQFCRQAPARSADQHFRARHAVAAIPAFHDRQHWGLTCQDGHLLPGLGQGVAIVGIALQGTHAHNEALVDGGGQADVGAELVALVGLAI